MTIKEIAEVAGVSISTARRGVLNVFPEKLKKGEKTELNHKESVKVMNEIRKKNFVSPVQNEQLTVQDEHVSNLDEVFKLAIINMSNLAQSLANKTEELDKRISKIETQTEQRKALLPPPQIKPRDHINMIVRKYSQKSGQSYSNVWSELYRQFSYRTNTDPRRCAKNRNMGILEYIELEGFIETLEAIAIDVFKED